MSLLTMIQGACARLAIDQPVAVIGSNDPTITQMQALLIDAGEELARDHNWSSLIVSRTFTCTGAQPEPTEPPSDWQCFPDNTNVWNVSRLTVLNGPVDSATWLANTTYNSNPWPQIYRIYGGKLDIFPNNVGEVIRYEYLSSNWIKLAAGGTGTAFANDADTALLPERVLRASIIYRWKMAKGLDFGASLKAYEDAKANEIGSDRSATAFSLARNFRSGPPDHFFPGIIQT